MIYLPDPYSENSISLAGLNLEVVEQIQLLGVIISSNLKWQANILSICSRAMAKGGEASG